LHGAVSEYGAFSLYPNATLGPTGRLVALVVFSCLTVLVAGALYQGRAWARQLTLILGAILLAWLPWRLSGLPPLHVVAICARTILLVLAGVLLLFRSARDWFRHHSIERAKRASIPKSYPPKVRAALEMLAAAGIGRSNTPPIYRLLWRLGLDVPPPHFAGFVSNCANTGIAFGVIAWVYLLGRFNAPTARIPQFLEFSAAAGLLVGVSMAVYFRHGATKYRLPPWSSLPDGPTHGWSHAVATRLFTFGRPVVYLLVAVFLSFKLGLFAPGLAEVKGTSIEETPLVDVAGHQHSFHELRGQATTIYFWATWCGPCLQHMSDLANGQRLPANEPFLPVAVEEDPKDVTAMLKRLGYHGAVWVATDGQALLLRRFAGNDKRAIPFVVKLDAAGKILEARYGDSAVIANDPVKTCRNDDNEDAKPRVAACTTLISKGGASEEGISDAYWHRALAYDSLKDNAHELADLDAFLLRRPDNAKAFGARGYMHGNLGDNDLAIADLERSIRLDGGSFFIFETLGDAYRAKRDFDRAEESYGHAIDMSKGDTYAWSHRCFTRAIIGKDLDAALADCNEAMKLTSREPGSLAPVLSYRCFAQYRMKHYREAIQDCDAAIAHSPTYAEALYVRGLAKRALGDASASADIDHARKLDPKIAQTYAGYGVPETP
jgi:tetratricopeptide (TPR) repeat protein